MEQETERRLLALNHSFYEHLANPFAQSRQQPQPGFERLLAYLPSPCTRVLDVGCGEGRFGRFIARAGFSGSYLGVDFSEGLLVRAAAGLPGNVDSAFLIRDLAGPGVLGDLGMFSLIVCLAVLQHIPGRANRVRLLDEMATHLAPGGRIFLSTWQFLNSPRQRRKLVAWEVADLDPAALEPGDYLLSWRSGGFGLRYAAYIDERETARLATESGLAIVEQFRSDGREGDLNLYTVLEATGGRGTAPGQCG